jgi:hypothetical protein
MRAAKALAIVMLASVLSGCFLPPSEDVRRTVAIDLAEEEWPDEANPWLIAAQRCDGLEFDFVYLDTMVAGRAYCIPHALTYDYIHPVRVAEILAEGCAMRDSFQRVIDWISRYRPEWRPECHGAPERWSD